MWGAKGHTMMMLLMSESEVWQFQSWRYYEETKTPWTWTTNYGVMKTERRMNGRAWEWGDEDGDY
jgi:hypothetical protein